jgi:hypothetical protein
MTSTRRVRVSLDCDVNFFPGSEPVTPSSPGGPQQGSSQRAVAPGNTLARGVDDSTRDSAHLLTELSARVAVGF